jgi:hypothetical protein
MQYELTLPTDYDMAWGEELPAVESHPDLHTAAVAFDPYHWQVVRIALWAGDGPAEEPAGERYEVLYLAAPEMDRLKV